MRHIVQQSIKVTVPARSRSESLTSTRVWPPAHVPFPVVESQDGTFVLVVEAPQISNRADRRPLRRGEETHSHFMVKALNTVIINLFILADLVDVNMEEDCCVVKVMC